MKISIITVFPELYSSFLNTSLILRAVEKNLVEFNIIKFSDMCPPKERMDEHTVGPGAGMIIKPDVVDKAIKTAEAKWGAGKKLFFSPQGKKLTQPILKSLSKSLGIQEEPTKAQGCHDDCHDDCHIILVCCRYEGQDARAIEHFADEVISIGDYVLMGGDLPAQVFIEGLLRLVPGIVGKKESVEKESFEGAFLDYPQYGLPVSWKEKEVPEILRSGNHAEIQKWREERAAEKTILDRFDWFRSSATTEKDIALGRNVIPSHYVGLMHVDVLVKGGRIGVTSITSLDIHDIARSSATYGIEKAFVVSPLEDQHKIVGDFLGFWKSEEGIKYNPHRYDAIKRVVPTFSMEEMLGEIRELEGQEPIIIATSAIEHEGVEMIDYYSQGFVWKQKRPVLFLFGTGHGLSDGVLDRCDYVLGPIHGLSGYNHLSVRSATAIVLDRWLGMNHKT